MNKAFKKKIITMWRKPFIQKFISDKLAIRIEYKLRLKEKLNLKNPKTYNEKIQWLKLYDHNPLYPKYVDKYEVREYIARTIGEQYLVPLIGVYNHFEEINFSGFPSRFVLKCTHDSGSTLICNKENFNVEMAKKIIMKKINTNYFYQTREWPYKNVKPRIICEELIQENIMDYKFMCFHGEPKLIQIHCNRNDENPTLDFYDTNWNKTEIKRKKNGADTLIPRPDYLNEMIWIAEELSKNEIHVRVDLYYVNGKIYFGEKTYYSASGFEPFLNYEHDKLLGSWIHLAD